MKLYNRRARYEYHIFDSFEAGIQLSGPEVKSVKSSRIKLDSAYVRILAGEAFLINASIPLYEYSRLEDYNPSRTRKLLLHRRELISLETKLARKKLTLIPLSVYTNKRGIVKLEIALARSKKMQDKRMKKKERDLERDIERDLRDKT